MALDITRRHRNLCLERVGVDEQVPDLPLLADPVLLLVLIEPLLHVGVGGLRLVVELVRGEDNELQLHLLVAFLEFGRDLVVVHADPVGDRGTELLDEERPSQVVLELRRRERRPLHLEDLLVERLSGKLSVLLKGRNLVNAPRDLGVGDGHAKPFGLSHRGPLVDQLLQDLPIDPHLLQELLVQAAAIGTLVVLQLSLIRPAEGGDGDRLAPHGREGLVRTRRVAARAQKAWDVENDE